ncbi:MAG: hypothetical protein J6Q13_02140 [Clostridia bacterium]|nr:hypothetical protein [Clostridia bacterium]
MKIIKLNDEIHKLKVRKELISKRFDLGMLPIIISMFGFGLAMVLVSPLFLIGVAVDLGLGSIIKFIEKCTTKKYDNNIKDLMVEIQAESETSDMSVEEINARIANYSEELDKSKHWVTILTNERKDTTSKIRKKALNEVISEKKASLTEQERYLTKMIAIKNRKENETNL